MRDIISAEEIAGRFDAPRNDELAVAEAVAQHVKEFPRSRLLLTTSRVFSDRSLRGVAYDESNAQAFRVRALAAIK